MQGSDTVQHSVFHWCNIFVGNLTRRVSMTHETTADVDEDLVTKLSLSIASHKILFTT